MNNTYWGILTLSKHGWHQNPSPLHVREMIDLVQSCKIPTLNEWFLFLPLFTFYSLFGYFTSGFNNQGHIEIPQPFDKPVVKHWPCCIYHMLSRGVPSFILFRYGLGESGALWPLWYNNPLLYCTFFSFYGPPYRPGAQRVYSAEKVQKVWWSDYFSMRPRCKYQCCCRVPPCTFSQEGSWKVTQGSNFKFNVIPSRCRSNYSSAHEHSENA